MLARGILGYLPATVLAPLATFAGLIAYSHLLAPDQYGRAVIVLVVVELVQVVGFQWLRLGFVRFWEVARRDAGVDRLQATVFAGWFGLASIAAVLYLALVLFWPMAAMLRQTFYFGLPLLLMKSLYAQCLEWHRVNQEIGRYSMLESLQGAGGVGAGLLLIAGFGLDERAILLGGTLGCAAALAVDLRRVLAGFRPGGASGRMFVQLLHYGLPLGLAALFGFIVNSSDRLLLQWFVGPAAVGLYSLGYNLADRSISIVFFIVTLPAFPLALQALEQTGPEAAKAQFRQTFAALAALVVPAVAGLIWIAGPLAGAMLGTAFVASATQVIPGIAVASLMAGLRLHYFDHAFLLRQRTMLLLWTIALPGAMNIALNLWWIPRFGVMGAVYSTIVAFAAGLILSIAIGRRVFAMPVAPGAVLRPLAATVFMLAVLTMMPHRGGFGALVLLVSAGAVVYGVAALLLDVGGVRGWVRWLAGSGDET